MMATYLFVFLIVLLIINVPLAFAVGLSSLLFLILSDVDLFVGAQRMVTGIDVSSLMAIPLFMIAGKVMEVGGISNRLINLASSIVGSITGGFAIIAVIASMFFAAISGSAPATVVAIGSILVPAMVKEGYDTKFSVALIAASGTIGIILPPSIPFITYGISANTSIGNIFMAGILPGILMGLTLIVYVYFIAKKNGYKSSEKTSLKRFAVSLKESILGLLMPLLILGGIYLGWFTPTESGAVATIYGLIVSLFIYRTLKVRELKRVFVEAGTLSAMVLLIVATANLMSWILTTEQIPEQIANSLTGITESPLLFLFIITLALLIIGTFMETNAAIILTVPILLPILNAYEIDMVHFGVLMIFNLAIGLLTPPLGVNLFVAKSLANISFMSLVKNVLPFILLMLLNLIILVLIPEISLGLVPE